MKNIKEFINGKKTYIVAIVTVLYAVVIVGWQGNDWKSAGDLILVATGFGALRHGINKG